MQENQSTKTGHVSDHHQQPIHFTPIAGVELYHEGSKSYWKVRANVDIIIVCHTAAHCVEVIVYDPERNLEANRIYLNSILLAGKADQKEVQAKLTEKKEAFLRQKKLFCVTQLTKELLTQAMVNYILMRLQIGTLTDSKFDVSLTPTTNDTIHDGKLDVIMDKPATLTPLACQFTKKVKSADINMTLAHLKNESKALKSATRIAELATSSVDGFKLMMEKKRLEKELLNNYSSARLHWIRAINRVLIQNYIEKVKVRLIKMGLYQEEAEEIVEVPMKPPVTPPGQKSARRTIDNSMLMKSESQSGIGLRVNVTLPSVTPLGHAQMPLAAVKSPLNQQEANKRRLRSHKLNTVQQRRSLNNEMFNSVINGSQQPSAKEAPVNMFSAHDCTAPTLMQSYSNVSGKLQPITTPMNLTDLKRLASSAGTVC